MLWWVVHGGMFNSISGRRVIVIKCDREFNYPGFVRGLSTATKRGGHARTGPGPRRAESFPANKTRIKSVVHICLHTNLYFDFVTHCFDADGVIINITQKCAG